MRRTITTIAAAVAAIAAFGVAAPQVAANTRTHAVTVRAPQQLHVSATCQAVVVSVFGRGTLQTLYQMPNTTTVVDGYYWREFPVPQDEQTWVRVVMRFKDGTVQDVLRRKTACANAY